MNAVVNQADLLRDKQLLIFDFDGTVADTSPLHAAAFSQVLAPLGIIVDYPSIAGLKTLDAMRQLISVAGKSSNDSEIVALVSAKQSLVRQMIGCALQPLPGVDAFLQWARPRYKLAMVTSGSRGTVGMALEKLGYSGWFDPLICADDVERAKPAPEGFLMALQLTGVAAGDALVFEDSEAGFQAAAQAGLAYVDVRRAVWPLIEGAPL